MMFAKPNVERAAPPRDDYQVARQLIKDLFVPKPRYYWRELVLTAVPEWTLFLLAVTLDAPPIVIAALVAAAIPFGYRGVVMIHELTHHPRTDIPGFHLAWNLVTGVPWLLPSILYEGVHIHHHRRSTYGTAQDPEYLCLAGRPWVVLGYLAFGLVVYPLMALRFLLAPVSWLVPPLRRWVIAYGSSYAINLTWARAMSAAERRRLFVWECLVLLAWWPPLALSLAGVLSWRWLACRAAIFTGVLFVNRLRMLAAHHFASGGEATDHLGQFRDSIDNPAGWWAELWAPLGLRYHALHHLFPRLPFHNLPAAYARLVTHLPAGSFYHTASGKGLVPALRRLLVAQPPTAGKDR
jgi:fatty acid desaturase